MLNLNFVTPKDISLLEIASYEPSCVKINLFVFSCRGRQEERGGKGRHKNSRKRYISPIRGEAPRKRIFTKFCTSRDIPNVINCANFGVEKLRGLGFTGGQILGSPIEMAGYPYNSPALLRSLSYPCPQSLCYYFPQPPPFAAVKLAVKIIHGHRCCYR